MRKTHVKLDISNWNAQHCQGHHAPMHHYTRYIHFSTAPWFHSGNRVYKFYQYFKSMSSLQKSMSSLQKSMPSLQKSMSSLQKSKSSLQGGKRKISFFSISPGVIMAQLEKGFMVGRQIWGSAQISPEMATQVCKWNFRVCKMPHENGRIRMILGCAISLIAHAKQGWWSILWGSAICLLTAASASCWFSHNFSHNT